MSTSISANSDVANISATEQFNLPGHWNAMVRMPPRGPAVLTFDFQAQGADEAREKCAAYLRDLATVLDDLANTVCPDEFGLQ